jgi:iron complex outermembrane receptor protein
VFAEAGQFREREVRASLSHVAGNVSADAAVARQDNGNYRDNSDFKQNSVSAGVQASFNGRPRGLRVESARQDMRLPGSLTLAQFEANPRQTLTPDDFGSLDTDRINAFGIPPGPGRPGGRAVAPRARGRVELLLRFRGLRHPLQGQTRTSSRRARAGWAMGGMQDETGGRRRPHRLEAHHVVYSAGRRQPEIERRSTCAMNCASIPPTKAASAGRAPRTLRQGLQRCAELRQHRLQINQGLNAWELQASYMPVANLTVYGKGGQSYRVANSDENAYTSLQNQPLAPQQSHDAELGATYANAAQKITARVFRHNLKNEIFYDPTANGFGANTNLDPTRRQGFELDAEQRIAAHWNASAHFSM